MAVCQLLLSFPDVFYDHRTDLQVIPGAKRIEYAVNLIRNTNSSILDIALDSGFNSIRTFNRCFKTVTGCIPTTIRKDRES